MNRWQAFCLAEMELGPIWRLRDAAPAGEVDDVAGEAAPAALVQTELAAMPSASPAGAVQRSGEARRLGALLSEAMQAPSVVTEAGMGREAPSVAGLARGDIATMGWDALEAAIEACSACRLRAQRNRAVPGAGDRSADWLLVGEGPGAEEDRRGEAFVGAAGHLLDAMLSALGLSRQRGVYIANTVKCRPPGNRNPALDEMAACEPFLRRQIELLQPRLILALGRPAAHALLQREVSIRSARGKVFAYQQIPLIVTYHPAYLLRNPHDKGKAWEDLCFARRTMQTLPPRG